MKKLGFLLVVFMLVSVVILSAQDKPANNCSCWALQFAINQNFTLNTFQGSLISLKKNLGESYAIRFGISPFYNSGSRDQDRVISNANGDSTISTTKDASQFEGGLELQFIWIFKPKNNLNFYTGVGPSLLYDKEKATMKDKKSTIEMGNVDIKSFGVGLSGLAGVEWRVSKAIGVHAEYRCHFVYQTIDEKQKGTVYDWDYNPPKSQTTKTSSLFFSGDGVRFGLSVYF